ncbi:Dynamin central region family protein [Tritrichomonas foetus]|uniref:Dynamin central region family protein n=1 Tax=Tritrichomonas foetus TaxID=1144522 RepID=A0A1J4KV29_9EUKA|nr:Dynamin central region family protein [Tritrichomonas foetus]|eukprot:OHT15091.1 Dynamin central region family protein [Tritrichomonas foetus]
MEKLIPTINKLQDVFNTIGGNQIDLPQIVVVGCQSSGKSSVLEAIVGKDFLPRGAGIVTKRPLVLQLVHVGMGEEEYGEFLHCQGKKFTSYLDMRQEIADETERTTGDGRNVSSQPINLRIQSASVPTLTMVDLPGLTKVAIEGQDPAIVEQIHTMVLQYITPKNSLILAVTPANQDLANSDSLRIAREVDPEGERTIGVITKVDLMDAGTDASQILENKVYPLKLGYIGVVNRSQRDIDTGKSMKDSLAHEADFFNTNPVYKIYTDRCGIKVLSTQLNKILVEHIRKAIPGLRTRVGQMITDKETELQRYGEDPTKGAFDSREIVMNILNQYVNNFDDLIQGKVGEQIDDDLKGGARISRIFTNQFEKEISEAPTVGATQLREVWFLIRNQSGITAPIYISHQAFESLIRRHIEDLRPPALKAVNLVANEILNIHAQVSFTELERYPAVKDAIRNVVEDLVNSCVEPTVQFVNDVIDNEKIFINTARHDFRGAAVLQEKKQKEGPPVKKTRKQEDQENTKTLVNLCARYFELVRLQIVDLIPKAVVMMLVEGSTKQLRDILLKKVYGSNIADEMMKEDPRITTNRNKCNKVLTALRKAQSILNEVRQISI